MSKLFAWTHGMHPTEVVEALEQFPGLGAVLYSRNLAAAPQLETEPIAYVTDVTTAHKVADLVYGHVNFKAAIILDELNGNGPSGKYITPEKYAEKFAPIYEVLRGMVPVHTMGLMPVRNWWRDALRCRAFDDEYHGQLPYANGRAFNPNGVRLRELNTVLKDYRGPWVLSPAPFRGWWDRLWSPISVRQWRLISERDNVSGVAFWCLREVRLGEDKYQSEHGLLDRNGNMTTVGRAVLKQLT